MKQSEVNKMKLSISKGNSKMGAIPSVSLPPITTCPKGVPCATKCYATKLCRIYPTVKKAYQNNLELLTTNWANYWEQVNKAITTSRYFRFHVAGDIPNYEYFAEMVRTAENNPHCEILAFTKNYNVVNEYMSNLLLPYLPPNLHIIFSEWGTTKPNNPYNLPTSAVIFKGTAPCDNWKICGGNCSECACRGVGCWELKKGETIAFYEH